MDKFGETNAKTRMKDQPEWEKRGILVDKLV